VAIWLVGVILVRTRMGVAAFGIIFRGAVTVRAIDYM
jgi:hypothetical protein